MDINFYNFKKKLSLVHEVDLSVPGVEVKSDAHAISLDDSGVIDLNLGEQKDSRINFLYDSNVDTTPNAVPPGTGNIYKVLGSPVSENNEGETENPDDPFIHFPSNELEPATLSILDTNGQNVNIPIRPAHEFMAQDGPGLKTSRSVLTERLYYAACGFWSTKNYRLSQFATPLVPDYYTGKDTDAKDAPWLTIKDFKKRLKDLRAILTPKGMDVIVTIFEKSLDSTGQDPNATGIVRKQYRRFNKMKLPSGANPFDQFKVKRSEFLSDIDPTDISPFDVSIQALQGILNEDAEGLLAELTDAISDVRELYYQIASLDSPNPDPTPVENILPEDLQSIIASTKALIKTSIPTPSPQPSNEAFHELLIDYRAAAKEFKNILYRVEWFEYFNGLSVVGLRTSLLYGTQLVDRQMYRKLARIMIPIDMGFKKTRVRRKGLFRRLRRYKTIKTDMGVRFAEVRFINTDILTKYRKNEASPVLLDSLGHPLLDVDGDPVTGFEKTKPDPTPVEIDVSYEIPHLPFDTELRKVAFDAYGYFDQTKFANHPDVRDSSGNILYEDKFKTIFGYEIFKPSSKNISDLRTDLDIIRKVQFLLGILSNEFGAHRVKLTETNRSFEDQEIIQMGSESSSFLSWHNYGLSVKIVITDADGLSNIKEGSSDFLKLLNIAQVFTEGCYSGDYGCPVNVVWCGRLKTGPDNFVWEFLPIGVEHKDAPKFRDCLYNQLDPVLTLGYVNVNDTEGECPVLPPPKVTGFAPIIDLNPVSQFLAIGGSGMLSVVAHGDPNALTYQWKKGNLSILGATSSILTFSNLQESDAGNYKCVVTNIHGSTNSKYATIKLGIAPIIDSQPIDVNIGVTPPPDDLWHRSFSYTLDGENRLSTVTETAGDSPFYPYVNKRMTLDGAMTIQFDYNVEFNGGGNGWNLDRAVAVADFSNFKKDKSYDQIQNSTIGGFAGWRTGEFGWSYFVYGAPEALIQAYSANGIWGNPLHGTTFLEISGLKLNGMRDITVHVIGKDSSENVIFDEQTTLTDRITGSDILVMVAGSGDVYYNDGTFSGTFTYFG